MWELYTGRTPFKHCAGMPRKLLLLAINEAVWPFPPGTPAWYADLATACLSRDPSHRPPVQELSARLARAGGD